MGETEPEDQLLGISELLVLAWASRNSDLLTEVVQIFDICGLPDQEQYTSAEAIAFWKHVS